LVFEDSGAVGVEVEINDLEGIMAKRGVACREVVSKNLKFQISDLRYQNPRPNSLI
jgi:hypothetical protein